MSSSTQGCDDPVCLPPSLTRLPSIFSHSDGLRTVLWETWRYGCLGSPHFTNLVCFRNDECNIALAWVSSIVSVKPVYLGGMKLFLKRHLCPSLWLWKQCTQEIKIPPGISHEGGEKGKSLSHPEGALSPRSGWQFVRPPFRSG